MESRFDPRAKPSGTSAKGLFQMTVDGVKQVYKYRKQKELGHVPNAQQTHEAFTQGTAMHISDKIFDEATNIQLGTEYIQYWIDVSPSVDEAFKRYRGVTNGVYYKKISACADKLKQNPESMSPLLEMVQ
jgi:hypothetical protein